MFAMIRGIDYHLSARQVKMHEIFEHDLDGVGNTVCSTIAIALKRASDEGRSQKGMQVLLAGWSVGYSWAGTILQWC